MLILPVIFQIPPTNKGPFVKFVKGRPLPSPPLFKGEIGLLSPSPPTSPHPMVEPCYKIT